MDAALFDTLRSSIPNRFDSEAEEMSLRILRALSRYEDVDDLPEGTVTAILMNQALRQRMGAATDADAQAALVRDEIVQAAASARSELSREQARVQALQEELDRARTIASRDAATAGESVLRAKEGIKELEAKLVAERTVSANLERRLAAIEGTLDSERIERQNERTRADQTRTRALFVVGSGVGLLVALALVWWTWSHGPAAAIPWRWRLAAAAGIIVAATLCVFLAGGQILAVRSWPVFVRCKKFYMTTSWAVILGVLVNALWDFLKK
jgi:hypothetical protein